MPETHPFLFICFLGKFSRSTVRFTTLPVCSPGLPTATWAEGTARRSRGLLPEEAATNSRLSAEGAPWVAAADTGKYVGRTRQTLLSPLAHPPIIHRKLATLNSVPHHRITFSRAKSCPQLSISTAFSRSLLNIQSLAKHEYANISLIASRSFYATCARWISVV